MELKKNNTVLEAALKAKSDSLLELQKEASFQANICLSNILHNKLSHVLLMLMIHLVMRLLLNSEVWH